MKWLDEQLPAEFRRMFRIVREPLTSWWNKLEELDVALNANPEDVQRGHNAIKSLEDAIWQHHSGVVSDPRLREMHTIVERCPRSTVDVFCHVLRKRGLLPEEKYFELLGRFTELERDPLNLPTLTVYFKVSLGVSIPRIQARAEEEKRTFEKRIPRDYLQALDERYEAIYPKSSDTVIIIDADLTPQQIVETLEREIRLRLDKAPDSARANEFMQLFTKTAWTRRSDTSHPPHAA